MIPFLIISYLSIIGRQQILVCMKMLSVSNTLYTVQLLNLTQKYVSRRESEVDITTHEQVFGKKT